MQIHYNAIVYFLLDYTTRPPGLHTIRKGDVGLSYPYDAVRSCQLGGEGGNVKVYCVSS